MTQTTEDDAVRMEREAIEPDPHIIRPVEFDPEELIDQGVALIVRGLQRIGNENRQNNPNKAADYACVLVNNFTEMVEDFDNLATLKEKVRRSMESKNP